MEFFQTKVVIATHYLVYGAPQALRDYLIANRVHKLFFIAQPLYADNNLSYIEVIENGKVKDKRIFHTRTRISIINYFLEIFLILKLVINSQETFDLFIGVDNLNTFSGSILRILGRVRKVIYYTIDYSPKRFQSKLLNHIYHIIDVICVKYADFVWDISPRIAEGRKKYQGLDYSDRQKLIPIGVWFDRIKRVAYNKIKKHQLLFLGHLIEKQGVQMVFDAIPIILKKIPDFHFLIIGGGEYEHVLKEKVKKMMIGNYVTFTGWIKNREKLDRLVSESACGIAPYDPEIAEFTFYADSTKIKDYLAAGLPVLLTNVVHNAKEIEVKKCGVIINYDKKNIAEAVIALLKDEDMLRIYRSNAVEYIKQFDWNLIFNKSL